QAHAPPFSPTHAATPAIYTLSLHDALPISPEVLQAIVDGEMLFAIDQAQYLQGYLPIVLLTQYLETGAIPLGSVDRVILTGPQIVTAETAADVMDAAAAGLR